MRRRAVRDLGTIAGIVIILAGVIGINVYMRLGNLKTKYEAIRRVAEAKTVQAGIELLSWDVLRETKGSPKNGGTFPEEVLKRHDTSVNLMGFMTPIDEFRDATHFMLLPLPLYCYFCEAPPLRDVMLVRMGEGETSNIIEEPVMVAGRLNVNQGNGHKFFYSIEDASLRVEGKSTEKTFDRQHRNEGRQLGQELLSDHNPDAAPQEELLPGTEVPMAGRELDVAPPPPSAEETTSADAQ